MFRLNSSFHESASAPLPCSALTSRLLWPVIHFLDSLQHSYYRPLPVVLFLAAHIVYHPIQVLFTEGHHAVPPLPIEQRPVSAGQVVDVMLPP